MVVKMFFTNVEALRLLAEYLNFEAFGISFQ